MGDVEAVGKPQNFEFSREKALCFQGPIFSKEAFSTASLGVMAEYTSVSMLERLGRLINRIQRVRNTIPVEMQRGDARHVALSGIQTTLCPLMLALGALEHANQTIPNIELTRLCGLKNQSNEALLNYFDTWAKLNLLVFTQFRIEHLLYDLLAAFDSNYNHRTGFQKKVTDLFDRVSVADRGTKEDCFKVMALLRNSLHNNSVWGRLVSSLLLTFYS